MAKTSPIRRGLRTELSCGPASKLVSLNPHGESGKKTPKKEKEKGVEGGRKPLQRNAGTVQSSVYLSLKTERPSPLEGRWIYTTVGSASNGHGQDC